jgi:hypothetical protein
LFPIFSVQGGINELTARLSTATGQLDFMSALQSAYTGTIVANAIENAQVLNVSVGTNVAAARLLSEDIIKNRLHLDIGTRLTAAAVVAMNGSGAVDGSSRWAWSPQFGFVNFKPVMDSVSVTEVALAGTVWSPLVGRINLMPTLGGVTNTCAGDLGGMAWGDAIGYIDFDNVRIDDNGFLHGRATSGSGDIHFG